VEVKFTPPPPPSNPDSITAGDPPGSSLIPLLHQSEPASRLCRWKCQVCLGNFWPLVHLHRAIWIRRRICRVKFRRDIPTTQIPSSANTTLCQPPSQPGFSAAAPTSAASAQSSSRSSSYAPVCYGLSAQRPLGRPCRCGVVRLFAGGGRQQVASALEAAATAPRRRARISFAGPASYGLRTRTEGQSG
jgi:hypothetical protein